MLPAWVHRLALTARAIRPALVTPSAVRHEHRPTSCEKSKKSRQNTRPIGIGTFRFLAIAPEPQHLQCLVARWVQSQIHFSGDRAFLQGVSHISQMTGIEHRLLERSHLPIVANAPCTASDPVRAFSQGIRGGIRSVHGKPTGLRCMLFDTCRSTSDVRGVQITTRPIQPSTSTPT